MMKKSILRSYFWIWIGLLITTLRVSTSCKKAENDGVNTTIESSNALPNTFMSAKAGSYWEYGTDGQSGSDNYRRISTGIDTVVEGLPLQYYQRIVLSLGWDLPEFFGTFKDDLVTLIDVDGTQTTYIPYVFYRRNSTTGDSWKNTGNVSYAGFNVNIRIESRVEAMGLNMAWGGNTFENIIHVSSDIYASSLNQHLGTLEIYFNDGIGIVKTISDFDVLNQYEQKHRDSLIDYKIIP